MEHPTVFSAKDAMIFPILCVLILFVINREGEITRNEAYISGICLIMLYLPFTLHSLEVSEMGLSLRHSILPRRRHWSWSELTGLRYRLNLADATAYLTLYPRSGRRRRLALQLRKETDVEAFYALLDRAKRELGADAVGERKSLAKRLFA